MLRTCLKSLVLLLLFMGGASAQAVQTPEGTVEFVGLERWTVQMIQDSMAVHAPGEPLGQCAAVLQRLGFPGVSSSHHTVAGSPFVLVTVIEPHLTWRTGRVEYFAESHPDRPEWQRGRDLFRSQNGAFQRAVQFRWFLQGADSAVRSEFLAFFGADTLHMKGYWAFLAEHRSPEAFELANWTLRNDGNAVNRIIATTILGSFREADAAWHALLTAQLDSYAPVAATASQVLGSLLDAPERRVDWSVALGSIRSLLLGTSVSLFRGTLGVLRRSGIDGGLAAELLRDGGADLLLAHLRATSEIPREPAHQFLVHLRGEDLGTQPGPWADWIYSLR